MLGQSLVRVEQLTAGAWVPIHYHTDLHDSLIPNPATVLAALMPAAHAPTLFPPLLAPLPPMTDPADDIVDLASAEVLDDSNQLVLVGDVGGVRVLAAIALIRAVDPDQASRADVLESRIAAIIKVLGMQAFVHAAVPASPGSLAARMRAAVDGCPMPRVRLQFVEKVKESGLSSRLCARGDLLKHE